MPAGASGTIGLVCGCMPWPVRWRAYPRRGGSAGRHGKAGSARRRSALQCRKPEGLQGRPRPGRPERLSERQQAALKGDILREPDPERDEVSAWRLVDLCDHVERRNDYDAILDATCRAWNKLTAEKTRLTNLLTTRTLPPQDCSERVSLGRIPTYMIPLLTRLALKHTTL